MIEPPDHEKLNYRLQLEGLRQRSGSTHAGLWLDRYLLVNPTSQTAAAAAQKQDLIAQTANLAVPVIYRQFFARWKAALPSDTQLAIASVRGRMVVGIGDKGVTETGITLHQTYGVPFIPGSALKGLAAAYAHSFVQGWEKPDAVRLKQPISKVPLSPHEIVFGSLRSAGYVTFFDALYIPDSAEGNLPLAPDVMTPHHKDYYGTGDHPPADWDNPTPVPFLTATGQYLIGLLGDPTLVRHAQTILGLALRDSGIGAKTAAGYGRMVLCDEDGNPVFLPERKSNETNIHPSSPTQLLPEIGAIFTGKVIECGDDSIAISVPKYDPNIVIAVLNIANDPSSWRVGDLVRVEVIAHRQRKNRIILEVRRAPKQRKS